jgi:hypothetical protein
VASRFPQVSIFKKSQKWRHSKTSAWPVVCECVCVCVYVCVSEASLRACEKCVWEQSRGCLVFAVWLSVTKFMFSRRALGAQH